MPVLSEIATMVEVAQGTSLARFGHGELLIMAGEDAEYQKYDRQLAGELKSILAGSPCLVGVPPKKHEPQEWEGFLDKYGARIKDDRWYGSSFVSRGDWVPWTKEYREILCSLWRERKVLFYASEDIKLSGAADVFYFPLSRANSFVDYKYHTPELDSSWDLVILSCGPTGTVLADRLTRKGIWAVDLGNFGKFL